MDKEEFSEEEILQKRIFPKKDIVLLCVVIFAQFFSLISLIAYKPKPQDIIDNYTVTVTPRNDGSLDIAYSFLWTPIDKFEPLTWVKIGVANLDVSINKNSVSDNIKSAEVYRDDDGNFIRLDFMKPYKAGEKLRFYYSVHQESVLCDGQEPFYDFVPGWFNETPVSHYTFLWKDSQAISSANSDTKRNGWYVWEGSLECGEYVEMDVSYIPQVFQNARKVAYTQFETTNAYNGLSEQASTVRFVLAGIIILGFLADAYLIDSLVSYEHGRGFIVRYGHHMHTYGGVNPRYRRAAIAHRAAQSSRSGFGGGGHSCACACACACAGGGRAGCSQKDTYVPPKIETRQ